MSFRENLKNELSYQGILVKELAEKTGINKRTLDNYLREKANIPPADIAVKIAKELNVSVEYLVTGKNSEIKDQNYLKISSKQKLESLTEKEIIIVENTLDSLVSSLIKNR